jgi:N-acetylglucosamine-6-sulfatase
VRSLRAFVATVACLVLAAAIVLAVTGPRHVARAPARPNIVFVLTDDLSMDLLRYMPHVQGMERRGLTFTNYFVSDSLCCPSRASIFTGDFPHNTHIFRNIGRHGGFKAFQGHGDGRRSFALALSSAGYRTAMMGKYLNGYLQRANGPPTADRDYVPAGWSEWDVRSSTTRWRRTARCTPTATGRRTT